MCELMTVDRNSIRASKPLILISIVDGENGEVVEEYREDIGDLDPFALKRLLQNVCSDILSRYRRDLLLGYARAHMHVPKVVA